MTRRLVLVVLGTTLACLAAPAAHARSRELVILVDVAADSAPDRVCIYTEKLGNELASSRSKTPPACAESSNTCSDCDPPPENYYGICRGTDAGSELHLKLEHAGLERVDLEGRSIRLGVDYSESAEFTPRIEVLGGGYHRGFVKAVEAAKVLDLPIVPRCIERRLKFPAAPHANCAQSNLTTNGEPRGPIDFNEPTTLYVKDRGQDNTVRLELCGTIYDGTFKYPPDENVILAPKEFAFQWTRSCFVSKEGMVHECPVATMAQYGHECDAQKDGCPVDACCYVCESERGVEFPTPIQFMVSPRKSSDTSASERLDPIVWHEDIRFPGDELSSYSTAEQRRVFLKWPADGSWKEWGAEIDYVEIVAPDGRVQRVGRNTNTLVVPGLQCHDRFTYRYEGRWPDKLHSDGLIGDTLVLETSAKRRQDVIIGLRTHVGALGSSAVSANAAWSPYFDVELVGLIHGGWEVALSGVFSLHPSLSQFMDEGGDWDVAPLARVLLGIGRDWHVDERLFVGAGVAGGIAFPALAKSWKDAHEFPVAAARLRAGYEVTRAVALELAVWGLYPEQYIRTQLNSDGPTEVDSLLTFSGGLSGGVQWADVF